MRTFTVQELKQYDGKDGRPAYFAYDGLVYDASDSFLWQHGVHQVLHPAGVDLSGELDFAPHGEALLANRPIVGTLVREQPEART